MTGGGTQNRTAGEMSKTGKKRAGGVLRKAGRRKAVRFCEVSSVLEQAREHAIVTAKMPLDALTS